MGEFLSHSVFDIIFVAQVASSNRIWKLVTISVRVWARFVERFRTGFKHGNGSRSQPMSHLNRTEIVASLYLRQKLHWRARQKLHQKSLGKLQAFTHTHIQNLRESRTEQSDPMGMLLLFPSSKAETNICKFHFTLNASLCMVSLRRCFKR